MVRTEGVRSQEDLEPHVDVNDKFNDLLEQLAKEHRRLVSDFWQLQEKWQSLSQQQKAEEPTNKVQIVTSGHDAFDKDHAGMMSEVASETPPAVEPIEQVPVLPAGPPGCLQDYPPPPDSSPPSLRTAARTADLQEKDGPESVQGPLGKGRRSSISFIDDENGSGNAKDEAVNGAQVPTVAVNGCNGNSIARYGSGATLASSDHGEDSGSDVADQGQNKHRSQRRASVESTISKTARRSSLASTGGGRRVSISSWKSGGNEEDLQLRPVFRDVDNGLPKKRLTSTRQLTTSVTKQAFNEESRNVVTYNGCLRHIISTPTSPSRVYWETLGALFILYDLIMVPLWIIFSPPEEPWMVVMNYVTLVYWTINIPATLLVGVIVNGTLVMKPTGILLHYAKKWLLIDLIVVVPDWVFSTISVHSSETDNGKFVKLLRLWRLFRTIRLLRALRLRWILDVLTDMLQTEFLGLSINIFKMMCVMFLVCHYLGCIWYLIGKMTEHSNDAGISSWLLLPEFLEAEWQMLYLTSVHWALAQCTPATMEVYPHNIPERAFSVSVVMFDLVGFSYVVGSITASLSQLRSMKEDFAKQAWLARRYLRRHDVPTHLSLRILQYLEKQHSREKQHVDMDSIPIFALLSEHLHSELQCSIYLPHLCIHPLFDYILQLSPTTMQRVADKGMSRKILAGGDYFFVIHDRPKQMGVLIRGELRYVKVTALGSFCIEDEKDIRSGSDCILEQVLWTPEWVCLGEASAMGDCELQLLSAEIFGEIVSAVPPVRQLTMRYAQTFMRTLNSKEANEVSDYQRAQDIEEMANGVITDFEVDMQIKVAKERQGKRRALPKSISLGRFTKGRSFMLPK
mmetsp:Transcript_46871/g.111557  ORF Transcript_46871/g.111557 Transcript_46871/m.111557 type:complete len:853 (+) Transcript_46871:60-2618(+)